MKTLLWLDDIRDPFTNDWLVFSPIEKPFKTIWVKSFIEFIEWIKSNGLPDGICFDHDLGFDENANYKTGYDCAKWLIEYCIEKNEQLPKWNVQSANVVGKENINCLLNNFNKIQTSLQRKRREELIDFYHWLVERECIKPGKPHMYNLIDEYLNSK